jgi:hypothetical protein
MKVYVAYSEVIKLDDKGSTETRYFVFNTLSKSRHSEWKSFQDAIKAANDLSRMYKTQSHIRSGDC